MQTTFSNAFSSIKMSASWFKFHKIFACRSIIKMSALFQVMAWRRTSNMSSSETVTTQFKDIFVSPGLNELKTIQSAHRIMKQNYKNITNQIIDGFLVRWQRALNLVLLDLQTCFLRKVLLIVVLVLGEVTGCNLGVLPENYQRNSDDIQL